MESFKQLIDNLLAKRVIIQTTFWLYFSEFVNKGLRWLIFLIIAFYLGPEGYGLLEYFLSFIGLFFLFADFGVSSIFIREYQQSEEKIKHIQNALSLKILISFICALLALIAYFVVKKTNNFFIYLFLVFYYLLLNIENFFESFFLAIYKTEKRFIFNFISSLLLFSIIFISFLTHLTLFKIALAYFLSIFVGLIFAFIFFFLETKIIPQFDLSLAPYYLKRGLALVFFGLLGYIFFSTDKIILAHLTNLKDVGYYSLATRILGVLITFSSLFNVAFYPLLSQKAKEKNFQSRYLNLTRLAVFILIFLGFLLSFLAFFLSPLIPFFFGSKYFPSVYIFQVFVWILIFIFPTTFLDYLLLSYHKEWLDFWITLIPAILNIILNFILIPLYGIYGAILASFLSQILNFFLTYFAVFYLLKKEIMI